MNWNRIKQLWETGHKDVAIRALGVMIAESKLQQQNILMFT